MKRPTLAALAKSRGMTYAVWRPIETARPWQADACSWRRDEPQVLVCIDAPTRRAATEGLRAALLALPEVKKEKSR